MYHKYQSDDAPFIDYELYRLPGIHGVFRGPQIAGSEYIAFVGASQTFGRFVDTPFPRLISRALDIEALNLGQGSVGPTYALRNPGLMERINGAKLVVLQVLSGRSHSNSLFSINNHGMIGISSPHGREVYAPEFYTWLLGQDPQLIQKIVDETRANYTATMIELLEAIKPPKVLFWFSVRSPDFQGKLELPLHRFWGAFPQMVNRAMVDEIRKHSDAYVECVSRRGLPQQIYDRRSALPGFRDSPWEISEGAMVSENRYYPSPEMHEEAAALLIPVCREMLDGKQD